MNRWLCCWILLATLVTGARAEDPPTTKARVAPKKSRHVLIFTHAAGFKHSSIMRGADTVMLLGRQTGAFQATISDDPAVFDAEKLQAFDAVVLSNTTGDWLAPGADADRLSARKAALLSFVNEGKGLAGWHSASDSNYQWAEFGQMLGGYFDGHPWHQLIKVKLDEPTHPLLAAFGGQSFEVTDEIYQFKDPYSRSRLRVLLSVDNSSIDAGKGKRADGDYAIAWVRRQGKGRVFYSSLGHREEIFQNPLVMQFYLDGIQYACGDLEIDDAPSAK